jgi:hypothetical protein
MTNRETTIMDTQFSATQMHIDELDREIESIRTERLLRSTLPNRPSLAQRAKSGVGHGLIALGSALVGDTNGRVVRTDVRA